MPEVVREVNRAASATSDAPYLTCLRPDEPSPVVYVTDPLAPAYLAGDAPEDALFGVVGPDRRIVWESDPALLAMLEESAPAPVDTASLVERFGIGAVTRLHERSWLQRPEDLCSEYLLHTGQIEVTAHGNWGCRFCPVASDPKPRETMSMPLFTEIVEKLSHCGTISFVTFHFFNEPTLDKHFAERLDVLREYGMKLSFFTNGSGFTEKLLKLLESGVLHHLVFNVSTTDAEEFRMLTNLSCWPTRWRCPLPRTGMPCCGMVWTLRSRWCRTRCPSRRHAGRRCRAGRRHASS